MIHAFDDLAIIALVLGGVGARGQLAGHGRFRKHPRVDNQRIHVVDAVIQVVLDGVEVAVVGVGDLGWDGALGDLVDIIGRDVQRTNHRVERLIHAFDNLLVAAMELAGVTARSELSGYGRFSEYIGFGNQFA